MGKKSRTKRLRRDAANPTPIPNKLEIRSFKAKKSLIMALLILVSAVFIVVVAKLKSSKNTELKGSTNANNPDTTISLEKLYGKYSTYLFLQDSHNTNNNGTATGFFVKRNGRTVLVSNYHVFTSCNTRTKTLEAPPFDTLFFAYRTLGGKVKRLDIDLIKIRKSNPPIFDYQRADIFAVDITDLLDKEAIIDTIGFFDKLLPDSLSPKKIFAIGYGSESIKQTKFDFSLTESKLNSYTALYKDGLHEVTNSYILNTPTTHGMSGSPVFYQMNDNNNSIKFGGVVLGHFAPPYNITMVVKPDEVLKEVQRVLSSKL